MTFDETESEFGNELPFARLMFFVVLIEIGTKQGSGTISITLLISVALVEAGVKLGTKSISIMPMLLVIMVKPGSQLEACSISIRSILLVALVNTNKLGTESTSNYSMPLVDLNITGFTARNELT